MERGIINPSKFLENIRNLKEIDEEQAANEERLSKLIQFVMGEPVITNEILDSISSEDIDKAIDIIGDFDPKNKNNLLTNMWLVEIAKDNLNGLKKVPTRKSIDFF